MTRDQCNAFEAATLRLCPAGGKVAFASDQELAMALAKETGATQHEALEWLFLVVDCSGVRPE